MNETTINRLNKINQGFYQTTAEEFDATRSKAWPGWEKLPPYLKTPLNVLDVGCGNGRLGLYLSQELGGSIAYHGVDSNLTLLDYARRSLQPISTLSITLEQRDILENPIDAGVYDLIAVFGVVHHIPGKTHRRQFLRQLAQHLAPGGILAFACWRFYEYPRFRDRIASWPDDLQREAHDYLLDWRRGKKALRYCHYVDDAEHDELVQFSGLTEVVTYRADGQSGDMNQYSLLQHSENS